MHNQKILYNFEDYIENIKKDGVYGGEIELISLSKIFNKIIIVLENNLIGYMNLIAYYINKEGLMFDI